MTRPNETPEGFELVDDTALVRAVRARRDRIDSWLMTAAVLAVLCVNLRALWVIVPRELARLFP